MAGLVRVAAPQGRINSRPAIDNADTPIRRYLSLAALQGMQVSTCILYRRYVSKHLHEIRGIIAY